MRWYDIEPDVYMAISMIECSNPNSQVDYAKFIIAEIKTRDINLNYIKNSTKNNIARPFQRWYDRNETLSTAIEYLKNTTPKLQREVSLSVLAYKNQREALMAWHNSKKSVS